LIALASQLCFVLHGITDLQKPVVKQISPLRQTILRAPCTFEMLWHALSQEFLQMYNSSKAIVNTLQVGPVEAKAVMMLKASLNEFVLVEWSNV
jgi:hypothetical protein